MHRIVRIRRLLADTYGADKRFTYYTLQDSLNSLTKQTEHYEVLPDNTMTASHTLVLDVECRDLERYGNVLYGVGVYSPQWQQASWFTVGSSLQHLIESAKTVIFHNAKFDLQIMHDCWGITVDRDKVVDTMVLSYLINPEQSHSLKELAAKELGIHSSTWIQVKDNSEALKGYCLSDCYMTYRLYEKLSSKLSLNQEKLFELECKVVHILWQMELIGIRVDLDALFRIGEELGKQLKQLEASFDFNLNSPEQLSNYLFITKNLNPRKYGAVKNKKGYSTTENILKLIETDLPEVTTILEHRKLKKTKSTFIDGMLNRAMEGVVHTVYKQTKTVTGRLASENPNLQNVPAWTRDVFIARDGYKLVSLDYSQCELRILAYFSGEPKLVDAFKQGEDIHTVVTKLLMGKEQITKEERRYGKTLNFGVIYGMQKWKLARMLEISLAKADDLLSLYWKLFPGIRKYLDNCYSLAIVRGYVETLLGRRRYFDFETPELLAYRGVTEYNRRTLLKEIEVYASKFDQAKLRECGNAPIQGSNADITKLAMVAVVEELERFPNLQARLLLQIHDELVFEVRQDQVTTAVAIIKEVMENVIDLNGIPLVVDWNYGDTFKDCK